MLNITKEQRDDALTVSLEGRLDTTTSPDLEKMLKESLDDVTELILDFENLEYISSAGLRVLLLAYKKMVPAGTMKLIHVSDVVKDILEITGFLELLNVQDE